MISVVSYMAESDDALYVFDKREIHLKNRSLFYLDSKLE